MQISLKWVNEFVDIEKVSLDHLIDKLTLGGFEIEKIFEVEVNNKKELTLDISATANRSDSLSIQGMSLEIATLLNQTTNTLPYSKKKFGWSEKIKDLPKISLNKTDCLAFVAVSIENLNRLTSPNWLKNRLICSGIMAENYFKDLQNYILLETGYPFEFYDLKKIEAQLNTSDFDLNLTVGTKTKNQNFFASNNAEYVLNDSILLVEANDFPISIGGIINNKNVECTMETTALLIEGSIFTAAKIRQQSRMLGLSTDRSSRYEKSLKNINLLESLYKLISLLRISNPELVCKIHTLVQPITESNKVVRLNFDTVKKVLGPTKKSTSNLPQYIPIDFITNSLKRLKFDLKYHESEEFWDIIVPTLRSDDITQEIDVIEEIGRLYGFDNFLTRLPSLKNIGTKDVSFQTRKKLTNCLLNLGLNELIQYSLVNEKEYIENEMKLVNPLVNEYANLRSSLLPNLLKSIQKNVTQGNLTLEGFEYGHVFSKNNSNIIEETEKIAGIFGGIQPKTAWSEKSKILSWFTAKGKIDQLFKKLNLSIHWLNYKPIKERRILHPYCTAKLYLDTGQELGIFGQIHPIMAKQLNISPNLYLFEFDFETIQNQVRKNQLSVYSEYSTYPKVIKDVSFVINRNISFNQLKKTLYLNGSKFLININLIDEYSDKNIAQDQISLCLQFVFQSPKKTLQNKKIESIMDHLQTVLRDKFNAKIRT